MLPNSLQLDNASKHAGIAGLHTDGSIVWCLLLGHKFPKKHTSVPLACLDVGFKQTDKETQQGQWEVESQHEKEKVVSSKT